VEGLHWLYPNSGLIWIHLKFEFRFKPSVYSQPGRLCSAPLVRRGSPIAVCTRAASSPPYPLCCYKKSMALSASSLSFPVQTPYPRIVVGHSSSLVIGRFTASRPPSSFPTNSCKHSGPQPHQLPRAASSRLESSFSLSSVPCSATAPFFGECPPRPSFCQSTCGSSFPLFVWSCKTPKSQSSLAGSPSSSTTPATRTSHRPPFRWVPNPLTLLDRLPVPQRSQRARPCRGSTTDKRATAVPAWPTKVWWPPLARASERCPAWAGLAA
jgi:hypothetical protein